MALGIAVNKYGFPNEITINENVVLPSNIKRATYKLYLSLPDSAPTLASRPEYAIRFANDNVWESITGYNSLNFTLNVNNALGVANNLKLNVTLFPIPANDNLTIELDAIEQYKIVVYNSLGQRITTKVSMTEANKMTLNTSTLSNGLYFVEFTKGTIKDTRKIIVKH